ncbi:hypothetical protein V1T76_08630 [Roseibium sp. FZY0029]|uniref:hypothetical protein n=1 Tax=Roseibium sp. FZY0029 TaxID=3116647 RepID=UPI002E9C51F4|nr:hypothetical protein [Roseibium sp. FZY0029]
MRALDQVDSCAQLFHQVDQDPDFYSAKVFLRDAFPDARVIEIVPGVFGMADVMIYLDEGVIIQTLI